jgi:hypothetical protein
MLQRLKKERIRAGLFAILFTELDKSLNILELNIGGFAEV